MKLRAGARVESVVDETQAIVVKTPSDDVDLRCGGQPMVPIGTENASGGTPDAPHDGGTLLGKRYADETTGLEVLCTRAGNGSLSVGEVALAVKEAKPLPSSD